MDWPPLFGLSHICPDTYHRQAVDWPHCLPLSQFQKSEMTLNIHMIEGKCSKKSIAFDPRYSMLGEHHVTHVFQFRFHLCGGHLKDWDSK